MIQIFPNRENLVSAFSSKDEEGNLIPKFSSDPLQTLQRRDNWLSQVGADPTQTVHVIPQNGSDVLCFYTRMEYPEKPVAFVDAIFTDVPNVFMTLPVADCPLLFVYECQKRIVGLVHAGWHGLNQNIVSHALKQMKDKWALSTLEYTYIAVSPYFHWYRRLCKDVSYDIRRFWAEYSLVYEKGSEYYFDLQNMILYQAQKAGLDKDHLDFSESHNTYEKNSNYFSNRKGEARNLGVIGKG